MPERRDQSIAGLTRTELDRFDACRLPDVPRSKRKGPNGETTREESRRECLLRLVAMAEYLGREPEAFLDPPDEQTGPGPYNRGV